MGCSSSKRVEATVAADVYRPPPTSVALFDISTVEEPWLITAKDVDGEEEEEDGGEGKRQEAAPVPLPLLDKLETYELAPKSWSEVSKVLEDLKPSLTSPAQPPPTTTKPSAFNLEKASLSPPPPPPSKTNSFHTLQELESQLKKPPPPPSPLPPRTSSSPRAPPPAPTVTSGSRMVKENSFILRDREERERQKAAADAAAAKVPWWRRDPLDAYPERCPPGNPKGVVLYTTTLRGVRRTFEDCERARRILESQALDIGVEFEERDVSLHGEFLREVKELIREEEEAAAAVVPRLFIRGRYVGGVEKVVELGENGKLGEMLRWVARRGGEAAAAAAAVGKGGRKECEGCGGARFLPCMDCHGSCKVLGEDGKSVERCKACNENGLVRCPLCH